MRIMSQHSQHCDRIRSAEDPSRGRAIRRRKHSETRASSHRDPPMIHSGCKHDAMPPSHGPHLRTATHDDGPQLLRLWTLLFDEDDATRDEPWRRHARTWFAEFVGDPHVVRFPVIEVDGQIVSTGIGALELGVPNPYCPRGRTVRLANVITHPEHRRKGYATLVVDDVTDWARSIDADRIDLSASPEGQSIYKRAGFVATTAPRLKLVL